MLMNVKGIATVVIATLASLELPITSDAIDGYRTAAAARYLARPRAADTGSRQAVHQRRAEIRRRRCRLPAHRLRRRQRQRHPNARYAAWQQLQRVGTLNPRRVAGAQWKNRLPLSPRALITRTNPPCSRRSLEITKILNVFNDQLVASSLVCIAAEDGAVVKRNPKEERWSE